MRITAGKYKGRKIEVPKGSAVRPTSDKVRQAIFNALNARGLIEGAVVIDAFCGTGALGLEALSRGASFCTFFDKNKPSHDLCRRNIESFNAKNSSNLVLKDITKLSGVAREGEAANLVFLDPPYEQNLVPAAVDALCKENWLSPECVFVIESAKVETIESSHFSVFEEKNYGDTKVLFAARNL